MDQVMTRRIWLGGWTALVMLALCIWATPARSQDVGGVIRNMQSVYANMQSFQAQFTQELTHQESRSVERRTGSFLFAKPMLVRWETLSPHPELLVVTSREIWNYLPDEDLAYRYSLDMVRDSRSLIMVITGQSSLDREFDVQPMANENGLVHLLLYPKDPAPQLTEAHVWIDPASFLIRQAMVMDFYGNTNKITFTSMTPGAPASPASFTFTPPPGVEVEDHTAGGNIAFPY